MDQIVFELTGRQLWGVAALLVLLILPIGISMLPYRGDPEKPPVLAKLKEQMGLGALNGGVFFVGAVTWCVIFASLFFGLVVVIWQVIFAAHPDPAVSAQIWDWRFALVKFTALTATLGAVVALPFTLVRLGFARKQTETAVEALFNNKIDAAVSDLHAQRQVTKWEDRVPQTGWEDDVTRRNGAIDRLEGLAIEHPDSAPRIARMLSLYVREQSRVCPPRQIPPELSHAKLQEWARELEPSRSDMEHAVQALGRLNGHPSLGLTRRDFDLREANLQGFDLSSLYLVDGNFTNAQMQGTNLESSSLKGAQMVGAKLQGARMSNADLQFTNLTDANLTTAILMNADLTKANLQFADLTFAGLHFARFTQSDLRSAIFNDNKLQGINFELCDMSNFRLEDCFIYESNFSSSNMRKASLSNSQFLHCNLSHANMEQTKFRSIDFVDSQLGSAFFDDTNFSASTFVNCDFSQSAFLMMSKFHDCAIRSCNLKGSFLRADWDASLFGDASVTLPSGNGPSHPDWPEHWAKEALDSTSFQTQWRAFQRSIGQDPDAPQ